MAEPSHFPTLMPWFRLLRLPNLLTIPGDPVAGFLLAALPGGPDPLLGRMLAAAGASLCLYLFGLILNDMLDLKEDAEERPERPLPSGQITVPQAKMAAVLMALSGLNLALFAGRPALYTGVALAVLIIAYNAWLKRIPVAGVFAMGACRGASLLLGAVAARPDFFSALASSPRQLLPAATAFLCLTLYVAAFSQIAKNETLPEKPMTPARRFPFLVLVVFLPALVLEISFLGKPAPFVMPVLCFFMVMALMRAWFLGGILYRVQEIPATVGGHIRNLLLLQACLCAAAGAMGLLPALTFVLLSLVFKSLSARFYSS